MTIIIEYDEYELKSLEEYGIKIIHAENREKLEEYIITELKNEKYVVAVYNEAWQDYPRILEKIKEYGINHYRFLPIDTREFLFVQDLTPKDLVLAKYYYLLTSMASNAQFKLTTKKKVSRRALLRSPITSVREYVGAPLLLNTDICASWKNCKLCIDSCPYDALKGKPPLVDLDKCTGCGVCTAFCPFGLLYMPGANIRSFENFIKALRNKSNKPILLIASCYYAVEQLIRELEGLGGLDYPTVILPVECPGWITEVHLLQAAALDSYVLLYCDNETLSKCGSTEYIEQWLTNLRDLPVNDKLVKPGELAVHLEHLLKVKKTRFLPDYSLSKDKTNAYKILAGYGIKKIGFSSPIVGRVVVDETKCILCEACSNMCTFNALKLQNKEDKVELVFYPEKCTVCGMCEYSCPYTAIDISYTFDLEEYHKGAITLATDKIARCKRCGRPIGSYKHIKAIEEKLKKSGVDKKVLESIWYCQECKVLRLIEEKMKKS